MTGAQKFPEYGSDYAFSSNEEKVLEYWRRQRIFERTVEGREGRPTYYFYDGPPFATGLPHYGHIIAGTIKDVVPRYWTMRGYHVPRRFGWDCHGLPVEYEMEKTLELNGSASIREYGVDKFNEACRGIVLRYSNEWKKTVERMGRWIDMENDYKTMNPEFMESVWWVFKQLWDKGLVYEGYKVVPYSWRLTAPLSNFEATQNYKDVQDPAISVLMPLVSGDPAWVGNTALAIWTTTPWTLPSNLAVAAHADPAHVSYGRYALAAPMGAMTHVILADSRAEAYGLKDARVGDVANDKLIGLRYEPIFSTYADRAAGGAFRVLDGSSFVSSTDGTGLVHMAPAFGEDDFQACRAAKIDFVDPVDMEAKFLPEVAGDKRLEPVVGQFVKDADKHIIRMIKEASRLLKHETINHAYPHCERTDTPLIYKAISSWFVKVESFRDRMVANNQKIRWQPAHIRDGRFGKWLENARDWCISRNRFWGTPIPVWKCGSCSHQTVVGSRAELAELTGRAFDDIHPHVIDPHKGKCPKCSGAMTRTPEVLDCWFESGSMPYAQEHYPFENKAKLDRAFPANFIAEGLDQTRGWFYTLTVLSTALFDKPAFTNCIVNGIVLAEDGRKMSKRLKNYPDPALVFGKYGADAMRLYLLQSPAVHGEELRFSEKGLLELMRAVMIPLWNAYGFFSSYANIDGWSMKDLGQAPPPAKRPILDRWILARAEETEIRIHDSMEAYRLAEIAGHLTSFVDDLTNWYIRLNRERFWSEAKDASKLSAYETLWTVLRQFAVQLAPSLPFLAETLFAALEGVSVDELANSKRSSVHEAILDRENSKALTGAEAEILSRVDIAKRAILLGRSLRGEAKIGLRQPLPKLRLAGLSEADQKNLAEMRNLVMDEVNVKDLEVVLRASDLVEESVKPNFKTLGKKVGGAMKEIQAELATWDSAKISAFETAGRATVKGFELTPEDIQVVRKAKPGRQASAGYGIVAELDTTIDEALLEEGLLREVVNRVQQRRKEMKLRLTDRISIDWWATPGSRVEKILASESAKAGILASETLASAVAKLDFAGRTIHESFEGEGELGFELKVTG